MRHSAFKLLIPDMGFTWQRSKGLALSLKLNNHQPKLEDKDQQTNDKRL